MTPMLPSPSFVGNFRRAAGFSLIEVTLALGIVTFALVGAIGVLPTALASSRQSFNKNRAAAIADTLFTSFRSQPFNAVGYLDEQFDANGQAQSSKTALLDLNASTQAGAASNVTPAGGVQLYATVLDGYQPDDAASGTDPLGTQRHLRFSSTQASAADYLVTMYFNNQPAGTVIVPTPSATANGTPIVPGQANQIELIICAISRGTDLDNNHQYRYDLPRAESYHFVSTIFNRTN